jgi:hypothetical protein
MRRALLEHERHSDEHERHSHQAAG